MRTKFLLLTIFIFTSGCTDVGGLNLSNYPDPSASIAEYKLCHGYGCSVETYAWFSPSQWKSIGKIFDKSPTSPEDERLKIAKAIAKMETYTGELVGTNNDQAKAPLLKKSDYEFDCIDETVNTTKYLQFLYDAGFFRFHTVGTPAYRGILSGKYPHNTATILDAYHQIVYVVDTYIYPNGHKPDIRRLDSWLSKRLENLDN